MTKPGTCTNCALQENKMIKVDEGRNPDILILSDFPKVLDIRKGAFFSQGEGIIRKMLQELDSKIPKSDHPKKTFTYAVRCCPDQQGYKVYSETYNQCSPQLHSYIQSAKPKVILALGAEALRSLGFPGNLKSYRGGIYQYPKDRSITVIPTYSAFQMIKQPGLVPVVKNDVWKAHRFTHTPISAEDMDIRIPKTPDEIIKELEGVKAVVQQAYQKSGEKQGVAVDTETTSLYSYDPIQRMIAISLSWDDNVGLAFPYEHREAPFPEEDVRRVKQAFENVVSDPGVSLVMFNVKFDYQWLVLKYGMDMEFPVYDGLIAEHILEEDKKGNYSLKDLIRDYFPNMGMYEDALQESLAQINAERREAYKAQLDEAKGQVREMLLEHWLSLSEDERMAKCAEWLDKGYNLGNYQDLVEVKRRKYKGEMVVLKKYLKSVEMMLQRITPEDLGIEFPEQDIPEPEPATFEDVPIDMMLEYAAIDAIGTRKVAKMQVDRFTEDTKNIRKVEKTINRKLPTQKIWAGFQGLSMPLCKTLAKMEFNGVRIDRERTQQYIDILEDKKKELEDGLYRHVGYKFDLSASGVDLRRILFEEMKYPSGKISDKTGEPSTDAETLVELYDEYNDDFLMNLLSWRKIDKCIATYLKNWLKRSEFDGRLHANFNQTMTATYRLSSSNPNLGHCFGGCKIP